MNRKITFIGDCHGKIGRLLDVVNEADGDAHVVQLGDMGLGFSFVNLPVIDEYAHKRWFRFIRGNHDSPQHCYGHQNYLGDFGYNEFLRMFWVSGAFSVDHAQRRARMAAGSSPIWWPDEELDDRSLQDARKLYAEMKPEIVTTHEAPAFIGKKMLDKLVINGRESKVECFNSRTAAALESLYSIHQPRYWLFGHYHLDFEIEHNNTKFYCLAELSHKTIEL